MQPVLSLESLSKYYTATGNVVVGLNNVSLQFSRGEFVAITGESGSGKSTLSNVICGILGYESGEMLFEGKPTSHYDSSDWERYRRDHISYISQDYGILPGASVMSNVVSALRLAGVEKADAKRRAKEILEQMELWQLRNRRASRLSSGQKQRLSIGRALAKPAPVLIADEPTGNLDPENSAKVISLLAQAAKSRLVLLVTHEFEEVRDCATRHIRLQDGAVVVDTPLRPANAPEELPNVPMKENPETSFFVTRLQLRSRPVWTMLMTLLFALTAFAVVAFMGSFVVALDDTNTRIYDPTAFINGDPCRIVVSRADLKPMTDADYETLANLEFISRVERNGYVADAQYAYRDGVDYTTIRTDKIYAVGDNLYNKVVLSYKVHANAPFLQLVPVLPEGEVFLKEGCLPDTFYEIVAHSSTGYEVGDQVTVFLSNQRYWTKNTSLKFEYTVVGLTDYGTGLYFSDDVGRFFQHVAQTHGIANYYQFIPIYEGLALTPTAFADIPPEAMPEDFSYELQYGECFIHQSIAISKSKEFDFFTGSLTIQVPNVNLLPLGEDPMLKKNLVSMSTPKKYTVTYDDPYTDGVIQRTIGIGNSHETELFTKLLFVNQETFDELCWSRVSEQVSLTMEHYAYTQRVLDAVTEAGYIAVSPYRLGAVKVDEKLAEHREQTMSICLLALLAVVVLQIVVLRALFGVQISGYRLLRNIGLVRASAKRSVMWQFVIFTVLGQMLAGIALWACVEAGIEKVTQMMPYLPPVTLAALSAVHFAAALTAAFWTVRSLQKQVYPVAGRFVDLQMDEEVTA